MRIIGDNGNTDWNTFGTYYIDYREKEDESLRLECYDSLLFADNDFLVNDESEDDYPMPMSQAVERIASEIGVEIDIRTVIQKDFVIPYPSGFTMREVLCFIASAHGGNWYITDENKLRLIIPANENGLFDIVHGNAKKVYRSDIRSCDKLIMKVADESDKNEKYESGKGGIR